MAAAGKETIPAPEKSGTWQILLCEEKEDGFSVRPYVINPNDTDDEISQFIVDMLSRWEKTIDNLSFPLSRFVGHGRRRKQLAFVNQQRKAQRNALIEHSEILRGRRNQSISLIRKDGEIVGINILGPDGCRS